MKQLGYIEAIKIMEKGNVILHFDKKDNKFQFLKMEEGTLFNAETGEVVDFLDENFHKIKKEHGIDLPALIEKIVK